MLILYDIDMTLLETRHIGIDCLHDAGRASFMPEFSIEGLNFGGCLDPDIIARMLVMNKLDPSDEHISILRRGYHERLQAAASEREVSWALPGAHELVRATREHPLKFTLGLLTGNFPETGTIKLERAGFDMNDFEVCVWGDDSPHHPPTRSHLPPVGLEKYRALKGHDISPESVLIVGDTIHDVSCALDSGCTVLAVATGHATPEELRDAGAHRVIDDLTDTGGILTWLAEQWRPVRSGERLRSLDTLRGFALLGILGPNIVSFGWPGMAMVDHHVLGDTQANYLGHAITSTVFLGKFMFIFAMLFGAGVVVYAHKYDQADTPTKISTGAWLWYRRCLILLGFGLIHAYLFWYGDILTWYALAGLTILWWIRRVRLSILVPLAIGLFLLGALLLLGFSVMGLWAVEQGQRSRDELFGGNTAAEIAAYTGTWLDALKTRFFSTLFMHLLLLPFFLPAIVGIMTLGMVMMRNGVLTGERSMRFYLTTGVLGVVLGGALTLGIFALTGGGQNWQSNFIWQPLAQPVGVPLALGYAMIVIAMTKTSVFDLVTRPLAAVGRMALTNYFLHTLLCTTFFYGYGFGYFASIEYPQLWLVIGAVWCVNIVFSLLWLRFFRFGPFEWLWRCMTYGKLLPILHTPSTHAQATP